MRQDLLTTLSTPYITEVQKISYVVFNLKYLETKPKYVTNELMNRTFKEGSQTDAPNQAQLTLMNL